MERDPYHNIPIVLKRLKQKNIEWRSTQRQWNQIWRELHEKNYLRSLDYMGPTFKKQDVMSFKPKAIREKMSEMRDAYRSWCQQQEAGGSKKSSVPGPPKPIVTFDYSNRQILDNVNGLVM